MPGYSIKQISALTGATHSYFRQNAHKIKNATKERLEWRFPIEGLAEFIVSNEKLLAQFKENLNTEGAIPFKYRESGKLLEEKIEKLLEEKLEAPIEMLTTKDIVSLPMGDFFQYSRQVSELCKTKEIFALKNSSSRFASWHIPTESFAMFLVFTVDEFIAFTSMCREWLPYWKERDSEMYKIANSIKHYLNKIPIIFDEGYTAQDLSDIFDVPSNEILSTFFAKTPLQKIRAKVTGSTKNDSVSYRTVVDYMRLNPEKVRYLYDKWARLSKEGSDKEYAVRHLLMLYEYYIRNLSLS